MLLACTLVLCFGGPKAFADPLPAVISFELAPPDPQGMVPIAADSGSTVGWSFTVETAIEVSSLGLYDSGLDGLSQPHLVGIWDEGEQLLTSSEIPAGDGNPLVGGYRYSPIQPILLTTGHTYVIGATVPLGVPSTVTVELGDPIVPDLYPFHNVEPGSVLTASQIKLARASLASWGDAGPLGSMGPGVLNFPDEVVDGGYFFAPNFRFTPIPEPGSLVILAVGWVAALSRRHKGADDFGSSRDAR
ncbi:MAG: hypothetical protein AMK72_08370 [Planctomycetes bacterium SM23_25]|nr:MAG: hypothetical protein AMK72_08370 [Planctomycetes bacterium SM23_25]